MDLGVLRTDDFSYAKHIHSICLKANRICGMVLRLFTTKSVEFKMRVFQTYIRPIIEYAAPVWNPTLDIGLTARLEQVLRRYTLRLLWHEKHKKLTYEYDERLKVKVVMAPSLQTRRRLIDLLFAYKVLHGLIRVHPTSVGLEKSSLPTCSSNIGIRVRGANSKTVSRSYNFRISRCWNSLPVKTKTQTSHRSFKSVLQCST
jgi:hypothetical protein